MIEKNFGHIVTITNVSSLFGIAGLADYSASKFAIIGLEESLRQELISQGKTGISTTLICYYYLKSKMNIPYSKNRLELRIYKH